MTGKVLMAPSILSADFTRLAEEVARVEEAGADMIHVDVMDGHFVPNLSIGPPVIRALKRVATRPLDVHLMIANTDESIDWYLDAGADSLTVHIETCRNPADVLARITVAGARAAITLNPPTMIESIKPYLTMVDMVLVMSVNPGFSGQAFIPESVERVRRIVEMCAPLRANPLIQVDGGITAETAPLVTAAGARCLVAGNAVFGADDPGAAMNAIRAAGEAAAG